MGSGPYFESIERGDVGALEKLVAGEPELLRAHTSPSYARDRQLRCTGLHAAIHARQVEAARFLVDAGIDIEARTSEGRTALHDSIEFGCGEITELLIERGAEVDICSAAILGRLDRLRELLDDDPTLANDRSSNLSPLGWASYGNQVETARELIGRGARMDDGELLCAASVGHVEVGKLLIDSGVDPNARPCADGGTALHAAAAMTYTHDSREFVRMLADNGADLLARTAAGKTARQIAENRARLQKEGPAEGPPKKFEAVAELLRELGG